MNITIRYSCRPCNLVKVALDVPARGEEAVTDWVRDVLELVGRDHRRRSARCTSPTCDLLIPLPVGSMKIGGVTLQ